MLKNPILKMLIDFFASMKLSCVLFFFLFLLTVLGTLDQTNLGLYETQKKYFESLFLIYKIGPIAIPLPGVYLVLIFLFINTIVGTIKRIPFKHTKYGIYIIHFSMLLLFAGSFITFKFSDDGQLTLKEGEKSSVFVSYHEWELVLIDTNQPDNDTEYIFDINFDHNQTNQVVSNNNIPFVLEILSVDRNAVVQPKGPMFETTATIVNGYFIRPLDREKENEKNIPALLLKVTDKSNQAQTHIVTGATTKQNSLLLTSDHKKWSISLRRKSWEMPFQVTLDRIERDLYPGTMQAQAYKSYIRKLENGVEEKKEIFMNHPLRNKGYILFQSGYMEDPNTKTKFSTFAVVQNPTDHVPLVACILVAFGMLVHFGTLLNNFINRETSK